MAIKIELRPKGSKMAKKGIQIDNNKGEQSQKVVKTKIFVLSIAFCHGQWWTNTMFTRRRVTRPRDPAKTEQRSRILACKFIKSGFTTKNNNVQQPSRRSKLKIKAI